MIAYWLKDMVAYYKNAARRGATPYYRLYVLCILGYIQPEFECRGTLELGARNSKNRCRCNGFTRQGKHRGLWQS